MGMLLGVKAQDWERDRQTDKERKEIPRLGSYLSAATPVNQGAMRQT